MADGLMYGFMLWAAWRKIVAPPPAPPRAAPPGGADAGQAPSSGDVVDAEYTVKGS